MTEGSHPFTECATFADDCKGKGYSFQSNWHYINLPYLDEAGTTLDDFDFVQPDVDVVQALDAYTKFLKGEISASETTYTSQVASKFSYENDQRSFALRMLIHYVGDVHQPLHSAALVDSEYTTGDRGGTAEKIPSVMGVNTLHFVWDSAVYEYTGKPKLPLSDSDWTWYTTESEAIDETYPVSDSEIKAKQFTVWANESLEMAEQDVYPDFVEGEDPDQAYKDKNVPLIKARINLAASRLAALMVDIYGTTSAPTFLQ